METAAQPMVETETFACPNCGKAVRVGAKFCTHCGFEIPQQNLTTSSIPPVASPASAVTVRESSSIPFDQSSPGISPRQAVPIAPAQKPKKRAIWPFLLAGLVLLCLVAAGGLFLFFQNPFDLLRTPVPSLIAAAPVEPAEPLPVTEVPPTIEPATKTILPSPTEEIPPTETAKPLAVLTATIQVDPTIFATATIEPAAVLSETNVLLEDEFTENLNANWLAWGDPRPNLRKGFGDSWLDLKAADKPSEAGTTSRLEIENGPGVRIEFEAQLNPGFPQYPLIFDWDPIQFDRGPINTTPTVVHFEIRKSMAILQAPAASNICQADVDGTVKHNYTIAFSADKIVELYIDEDQTPLCHLDMGIKSVPGRISFTGNGWVTRILVTNSGLQ
jgi:hypothetical protein